jgi:hypothetical protein
MRFITNIINRRKVWSALADYPVYSPPFHDAEAVLSRKEIKANWDYFLEQKAHRIRYLANYLASFGIDLRLDQTSVSALGGWLYRYGGHLIPPRKGYIFFVQADYVMALHEYEPAWTGELHGLNIINDIAIFAGDYIISKNRNVEWEVYYGNGTEPDYEDAGFGQPCLVGLSHFGYQGHHSIVWEVKDCCSAAYLRLKQSSPSGNPWDAPGEFARLLDYLGDPNPPEPVPLSQLLIDAVTPP